MADETQNIQSEFMTWLSSQVPREQLLELLYAYREIEKCCLKIKFLTSPLFETTDFIKIRDITTLISRKKIFRIYTENNIILFSSAMKFYYKFINENYFSIPEKRYLENSIEIHSIQCENDRMLYNKYTQIFKSVFKSLREISEYNQNGITVHALCLYINNNNCYVEIKDILENVSWVKNNGDKYVFSREFVTHAKEHITIDNEIPISQQDTNNFIFRKEVDWSFFNYGFTIPQSVIDAFCSNIGFEVLRGNRLPIKLMVRNNFYPATLNNVKFLTNSNTPLQVRYNVNSSIAIALREIFLASYNVLKNFDTNYNLFNSKEYADIVCISSGVYGLICHTIFSEIRVITMVSSNNHDNDYSIISNDEKERITSILAENFKNGYRTSSNIDFERFKNYYTKKYGEDFLYPEERFNELLLSDAVNFDDRSYVYADEVVHSVRMYLEQLDSPCIYIDIFYQKYSDEFYSFNIFSVEMLRAFVGKNYYDITIKWNYILMQNDISPSDLIKITFGERETWSLDELQERFPYLRMETIRQTLNGVEYIRIEKSLYTHIDNLDLPDSEGENIVAFLESKFGEMDYVTANELDLSKFESLNPHCSFTAIRDAVFYKFLFNSYDKSGQVITKKGVKLRVLDILEQYCHKAETVSFDELNAFEATFDPEGRTHSQCLIAGHNKMIRVNSELFVANGKVDFDVEKIDDSIALYCHDNFIPLRRVTDFSLFPYAGYQWNLFMLESYVRRFSSIFKFDVRAVNSANIGVIVRKCFNYNDYDDILAIALANSPVMLSDKISVGNYLYDNGYIGWHNLGKNEKIIIDKTKKLREGNSV